MMKQGKVAAEPRYRVVQSGDDLECWVVTEGGVQVTREYDTLREALTAMEALYSLDRSLDQ